MDSPSGKQYKIRTVQELHDIVDTENVGRLCEDLTLSLYSFAAMKKEIPEIRFGEVMTWTDDGVPSGTAVIYDRDNRDSGVLATMKFELANTTEGSKENK